MGCLTLRRRGTPGVPSPTPPPDDWDTWRHETVREISEIAKQA